MLITGALLTLDCDPHNPSSCSQAHVCVLNNRFVNCCKMCQVSDAIKQSRQSHLIWEGWFTLMLLVSTLTVYFSFLIRDKTNNSNPASYRDIDILGDWFITHWTEDDRVMVVKRPNVVWAWASKLNRRQVSKLAECWLLAKLDKS